MTNCSASSKHPSKSVLIITSSGGGGILQAANAKEQEVRRDNPDVKIIKKDLLKELFWKSIGKFGIYMWDKSQRKGNVRTLVWLIKMQKYAEILFWLNIFFRIFNCLMKEEIDRVIDTQPMGTSPIVKAIRLYNKMRKKNVALEKVMVDLPTKKATHYFRTIKKLGTKDKKYVRVVTIEPLLEEEKTADEFWLKHCGLLDKEIQYEPCFIREGFNFFRDKKRGSEEFHLKIRFNNPEEFDLIKKSYKNGSIQSKVGQNDIEFTIAENDKLITILLGSQPAYGATFNYMKKIIEIVKFNAPSDKNYHLFAFCAEHKSGANSLFKIVNDYIDQLENYPSNLSIIPMSFQKEDSIASLFFRSDITFTRSGGQTSMELLSIMSGNILIHSEAKIDQYLNKGLNREQLLKGIPGWEAGNACYLQEKRGAHIVTPESCAEIIKTILK